MSQSSHSFNASERVTLTLKRKHGDENELPCKLLIMGDYQGAGDNIAFYQRTSVDINKRNFNQVMHTMAPRLKTTVPNLMADIPAGNTSRELPLDICFRAMEDFHPDNLVRQIPSLDRVLRLRELLVDLKTYPNHYQQIVDLFVRIIMDEH